ncbi:hypothetical protein Q4E93_07290 [Flavitalea sp. BT771]|uniref:hypothetical protein n=1 Tax=Flavitalea sp. BT771 TaxID=3063329 RepID=UPI0026E4313A|nr:hypothetical protein [Flavitalea sp. BT771]MDO6430383.1 hypothetical protein [Flavitalea sp. BT771]MDV6219477.1 hypothetical protein [Flavitalea sp. BT771]
MSAFMLYGVIKFFRYPKPALEKEKAAARENHSPNLQPGKLDPSSYVIMEKDPVFYREPFAGNAPVINGIRLKRYDSSGFTIFGIGNTAIPLPNPDLQRGITFSIGHPFGCKDHKISLFLKNMKLYVAADFKDLGKEETMGAMEFNHWKLYKANLIDFSSDDFGFEIKDKQGKIAFSICCGYGNVVYLAGYFINQRSVMVLQNNYLNNKAQLGCFGKSDSGWRQRAEGEVGLIKSLFGPDRPY